MATIVRPFVGKLCDLINEDDQHLKINPVSMGDTLVVYRGILVVLVGQTHGRINTCCGGIVDNMIILRQEEYTLLYDAISYWTSRRSEEARSETAINKILEI